MMVDHIMRFYGELLFTRCIGTAWSFELRLDQILCSGRPSYQLRYSSTDHMAYKNSPRRDAIWYGSQGWGVMKIA